MFPEKFAKEASRPSFITPGFSFLISPKFLLSDQNILIFQWQIKCIRELPALSIKILSITHSPKNKAQDFSHHFSIPENKDFAETKALPKRMCACIDTECIVTISNIENLPYGKFRLAIELKFWHQSHIIHQWFTLQKVT